jgi:hypothetical protein
MPSSSTTSFASVEMASLSKFQEPMFLLPLIIHCFFLFVIQVVPALTPPQVLQHFNFLHKPTYVWIYLVLYGWFLRV